MYKQLLFRQPLFSILFAIHVAAAFLFVISTRPTGWLVAPASFFPILMLGYGRQLLGLPLYWERVKTPRLASLAGWRFRLLIVLYPASVLFGLWFGLHYRPAPFSGMDLVRYVAAVATGVILPIVYLSSVRSIDASAKGT